MTRLRTLLIFAAMSPLALADFTYDSTSKITGGALVGMIKMAGAFSKDARKSLDPIPSTVTVKGNRLVHKTADNASIIDLDKETITNVNYAKSTYSVVTFAQMKQAMDDMSKKMQQRGGGADTADMKFDFKVKNTGQQRTIAGVDTREMVMTMTMEGQDAKSGQKGGIDMVTDTWLASGIPGYAEVIDFYKRMGPKLAWTPGGSPMMNRPDIQKAMSEFYSQGSKMNGMPMLQNIKMGGAMEGMPPAQNGGAAPAPSVSDLLGGRFGGLGRKKKEQPAADSSAANADSGSGSLIEMTMETTRYSDKPADAGLFEVPAGFKQVQEDPLGQRRR